MTVGIRLLGLMPEGQPPSIHAVPPNPWPYSPPLHLSQGMRGRHRPDRLGVGWVPGLCSSCGLYSQRFSAQCSGLIEGLYRDEDYLGMITVHEDNEGSVLCWVIHIQSIAK